MSVLELRGDTGGGEPVPGSFQRRILQIKITLAEGEFRGKAGNTVVMRDFAMKAKIEKAGGPDFGKAAAQVYGLPLEVMEQLSTLAQEPTYTKKNLLTIEAGDDYHGLAVAFYGSITKAGAAFSGAPDVAFECEARAGYFGSVTAQGESVIAGEQGAAQFIEKQVKAAGFSFRNEGVTASIVNAVFSGSPIEQARQCARQIGAELVLDDGAAILLENGAARRGTTPVLSAESGLLGYPKMTQNGVELTAIYDPAFQFAGSVKVQTIVPKCSGLWRITKLSHELEANMPKGGKWDSQITAADPNMKGAVGKF